MPPLHRWAVVAAAIVLPMIVGTASAADMPAIVEKFEETKDLWDKLHDGRYLTTTYSTPIDGPSPPWQSFLKTYGGDIVEEEFNKLERTLRTEDTKPLFKRIYKLTRHPARSGKVAILEDGGPHIVASRLITRYAEHLNKHPHLVDVYWHMNRPNEAESLLVPPHAGQAEDNFLISE